MRFQIIGNQISRTDKDIVTTRNVNYITCTFDFDESYRDLSLYAVFYRNEEQNFVVDVTNGECLFPWELLETAGVIYVGAYGVKGSTDTLEKRATTNAVVIRVVDSLSSDNLPELTPTPDVWEQYRAEVLGYRDATKLYTAQAETYATEAEGNAVTAVRSASQANASALLADESAVQAEQAAASITVNAKEVASAAENAKESADQALLYRNQAEEIKNSVRIEYDVQPTKIGIKQGDETEFTYTDDLTGPSGDSGNSGEPIATGVGTNDGGVLVFSVSLPDVTKQNGTSFIMIPNTSFSSSYFGVALKLNDESGYSVVGTYCYGDSSNINAFQPIAYKPYRLMYDAPASCWVATDYIAPAKFIHAVSSSGSGSAFTVTVPGLTLQDGVSFTMIPKATIATGTATLNVNGTGAKTVFHRTSNGSITGGGSLVVNAPVHVVYSSSMSCWIVDNCVTPLLSEASGVLPIANGGTGAISAKAARQNLGIYQYSGNIASSSSTAANAMHEQTLSAKTIFGLSSIPSTFQVVAGVSLNANMNLTVAHTIGTDSIKVRLRNVSGGSVGATTFYYSIIGMVR